MTDFFIKLLEVCPTTQDVCKLTRLSWSTVNSIMVSAVERGMLRRTTDSIDYLRIDEKSSQKGHSYVTILADIASFQVLDLVKERKLTAAQDLIEILSPKQRQSVKAVAMDMWLAFMRAARQYVPQAAIMHDKFHVSKYLRDAVITVRKQEHRRLSQQGASPFTGSKCVWLKI
ncbi:hypothetical protein HC248_03282 [Polaromonas vacuolata]|uniref:Transposase IS204/IS1001/IS1096/IS1165 DDE domain-containing protein n=1 Tax=Polaromonas vacuolata TaxID=37448 RepID=A0A6H2HDP0_9BURK|nr:hypothetical protein HC248_03282 [Polaromonas vacuolata]